LCRASNINRKPVIKDPDYWYVLYSNDYTSAIVKRHGKEDLIVQFMGDENKARLTSVRYLSCCLASETHGNLKVAIPDNFTISQLKAKESYLQKYGKKTVIMDSKFEIEDEYPVRLLLENKKELLLNVIVN